MAEGVRITGTQNVWFGGNNPGSLSFDAKSILADPKFVDVDEIPPDFHLQTVSPAILSGDVTVLSVVTSDYDVNPIPRGASTINRGAD